MSEERKLSPPQPSRQHLPSVSPTVSLTPALPTLPSSSGKILGSRTTIMRADAEFIRGHTEVLQAKAEQANALVALAAARIGVALKMCEFAALPEMARHAYENGRRARAHDIRTLDLKHQTEELQLQIERASAAAALAQYVQQPVIPPTVPPAPTGLTPSDVEKVAQIMPDMKPETIQALVLALGGVLAEKSK